MSHRSTLLNSTPHRTAFGTNEEGISRSVRHWPSSFRRAGGMGRSANSIPRSSGICVDADGVALEASSSTGARALVVFVLTPTELRLKRLLARERERYGIEALTPGGIMYKTHVTFMNWAAGYDQGGHDGRSRSRHEAWLARLPCPVLRVDGSNAVDILVRQVAGALG